MHRRIGNSIRDQLARQSCRYRPSPCVLSVWFVAAAASAASCGILADITVACSGSQNTCAQTKHLLETQLHPYTRHIDSVYAEMCAAEMNIEGKLITTVRISPDGTIERVKFEESTTGNRSFDKKLERYIYRWRFDSIAQAGAVELGFTANLSCHRYRHLQTPGPADCGRSMQFGREWAEEHTDYYNVGTGSFFLGFLGGPVGVVVVRYRLRRLNPPECEVPERAWMHRECFRTGFHEEFVVSKQRSGLVNGIVGMSARYFTALVTAFAVVLTP